MKKFFFISFFIISWGGVIFAAPEISHHIAPQTATIGDELIYELTATYNPAEDTVTFPEFDTSLAPFELKNVDNTEKKISKTVSVKRRRMSLAIFKPGEYVFPTQNMASVQLPALRVTIQSVLNTQTDMRTINDIKKPMPMRFRWGPIIGFIFLIVLGIAGIVGGIYGWLKRKKRLVEMRSQALIDPRSADEIALEALSRLKKRNLLKKNKIKEFHFALTEIVKAYFSRVYHQKISEMTTEEILQFFSKGIDDQTAKRIRKFFEVSDWVKFAKWVPEEKESEDNLARAIDVIQRTKSK